MMLRKKDFLNLLWIILYLALIDITVNIIFKFPEDPQKQTPSFLQEYFEYGRSIEGKFQKMIRSAKLQAEPMVGYGWLRKPNNEAQPRISTDNQTLVVVYGMSHTKLLGEAMAKLNKKYVIRNITAPGAPVGWSFTAYKEDREKHEAKIVILGIMTDNIALLGATSGATTYFDLGHPYTFPRYILKNNILNAVYPPFISEEGFKEYFNNRLKWQEYRKWLSLHDKFYEPFLFIQTLADGSSLFRIVRRAYSDAVKRKAISRIYTKNGFTQDCEEILVLQAMVKEFAVSVRRQNRLPIVYIVNNEGRSDHLYKILQPLLETEKIPFLSTHIICPPDDPRVFTGTNSHFIPSKDIELAKKVINIIEGSETTYQKN
jgi:hypothetical protein